MRITGGHSKGRHLAPLKGLSIRPTSDKVRESIFNLIGQDLSGLNVLDLFSGTGSLGIEALSRGASWVLFIDNDPQSLNTIRKNLTLCHFEKMGALLKKDLRGGLPWKHPLMKKTFIESYIVPLIRSGFIMQLALQAVQHGMLCRI